MPPLPDIIPLTLVPPHFGYSSASLQIPFPRGQGNFVAGFVLEPGKGMRPKLLKLLLVMGV